MARFRRWYRRRYGRRSWNRFRRYRRRYRRFVNSSSRSRVRVKIPVQFNVSLNVPAAAHQSNVLTITPFYSNTTHTADGLAEAALRGGLLEAPLFTNYANLYDAFKLDGMKVAISITSPVGVGANAFPSLSVYTGWDRQFQVSDWSDAAAYPTCDKLKNASSFLASTALNNSITKLTRSCYASDLFEKSSFKDCDHTSAPAMTVAGVANQNVNFFGNSIYPQQNTLPAFAPGFMFGVDTGSNVDLVTKRPVDLVCEVMYYVTFRNPKYGGASNRAGLTGITRSIAPDLDGGGDDDGFDIDLIDDSSDPMADEDQAAQASADPPRRSVMSKAPKTTHAARVVEAQRARRRRRLADEEPPAPAQPLNE